MGWTVRDLDAAVQRAHAAMADLEQDLNDADSKLGDGDTGGMLARVLDRMAGQDLAQTDDIGAAFAQLAKAAASATGSSLGTLLATALLTFAKATNSQSELDPAHLGTLIEQARDAMMARGGAELGDKTVLDSLDAIAAAFKAQPGAGNTGAQAVAAADAALDAFRNQPSKRGRARMFGDATVGRDDPGMLAVAGLTRALAGL